MMKISTVAKAALLAAPLLALPALKPAQAMSVPTAGVTTATPGAIQDVQYWHRHHHRYWRHRRWCYYHGC